MIYGNIMDVTAIAGLSEEDISNEELSVILELARRIVFDRVSAKVFRENPERIDANYLVYQVKHYPIADLNGDGVVDAKDVKVEVKNPVSSFDMWGEVEVETVKPDYGLIKLVNPVDNASSVFVTYAYLPPQLRNQDLDDAVNLMAAHILTVRLQNPDTIAISDFNKNELIVREDTNKFLKLYKLKEQIILSQQSFRWSL